MADRVVDLISKQSNKGALCSNSSRFRPHFPSEAWLRITPVPSLPRLSCLTGLAPPPRAQSPNQPPTAPPSADLLRCPPARHPPSAIRHLPAASDALAPRKHRGIATRLMRCSQLCMQESFEARYVSLHVRESNRAAFHLYKTTLGYQVNHLSSCGSPSHPHALRTP